MYLGHIWNALKVAGLPGASQRINADSVLAQYCGLSANLTPTFFSISKAEPKAFSQIASLNCQKVQRGDGSWVMSLELLEADYLKEFDYLCSELFRSCEHSLDEKHALLLQYQAFEEWLSFFRKTQPFSLEKARGLFGELTFMISSANQGEKWADLIAAWMGPFGGHQDFVFEGFRAVEVKTIQPSATEVQIASEHQLLFSGDLKLRIYRLLGSEELKAGKSLVELVSYIEQHLSIDELKDFRKGLSAVGFDGKDSIVQNSQFEIGDELIVNVHGVDFPRVITNNLNPGVQKVEYRITLANLEPWVVKAV
jgi:hypothetical protein